MPAERLFGCDPVQEILDVCRDNSVAATLARSETAPERLPFPGPFDLAFRVLRVHAPVRASAAELPACPTRRLVPGGILVVTVRPPEFLRLSPSLQPVLESLSRDYRARLAAPRYLFAAHPVDPARPQYAGDGMTYGETVVTLGYVRERWS